MSDEETTVMLLLYRTLLLVRKNDGWSELNDDCQEEVTYAINQFEQYNRVEEGHPPAPAAIPEKDQGG